MFVNFIGMEKEIIGFGEIEKLINEFVGKRNDFLAEMDFIVGVSRGGLVPAAMLAAKIDKPLAAAYIDKNNKIFFDRADWIKGKNVLVVDDIVRSGKTLWLLKKYLAENCTPKSVLFFTLFNAKLLKNEIYSIPLFSREVDEDVIFPWDYDRK